MLGRAPGPNELEPFTLSLLDWYLDLGDEAVGRANQLLEQIETTMLSFLAQVDVTMSPTLPMQPPMLGTLHPGQRYAEAMPIIERMAGYTAVHNIAGAPAMSVPLHVSAAGLPIGIMFAAPPGQDRRLFEFAYELEAAARWRQGGPDIAAADPSRNAGVV